VQIELLEMPVTQPKMLPANMPMTIGKGS